MPRPEKKEREGAIVGGLVLLMVLLWLGFFVHREPRFAGSLLGHSIGILGAALMLVPLLYSAVKRISWIKKVITPRFPMRTLLAWHIYAGIIGPILVLLHTGHQFESPLGIFLTSWTILVVLSGYVGRYMMRHIGTEIRDKKKLLLGLQAKYDEVRRSLSKAQIDPALANASLSLPRRLMAALFVGGHPADSAATTLLPEAARLAESCADLEYAVRTHEFFKLWFGRWLKFHIAISLSLYLLLGLHIWASLYFGLRWLG